MSGPVPSPSMNGMMGLFGTWRAPPAYPIRSPLEGTVACLYVAILGLVVQGGKPEKVTPAATGGPAASPRPSSLKNGNGDLRLFQEMAVWCGAGQPVDARCPGGRHRHCPIGGARDAAGIRAWGVGRWCDDGHVARCRGSRLDRNDGWRTRGQLRKGCPVLGQRLRGY